MKWNRAKGRRDRNVIDARGSSPRGAGRRGGGGLPIPTSVAGLGGGAGVVILIVIVAIQVFGGGGGGGFDLGPAFGSDVSAPGAGNPVGIPPAEDPQRDLKEFSTFVFNDDAGRLGEDLQATGGRLPPGDSSTCTRTRCAPAAAARRPRRSGPSTAPPTSASTWI